MNSPKRPRNSRRKPSLGGNARSSVGFERLEQRLPLAVNVLSFSQQNTAETQLTPETVAPGGRFGKLYDTQVDGQAYAQPLVDTGVTIGAGQFTSPGAAGVHNVVYVATENDSLYAIDSGSGAILWFRNFLDPTNPDDALPGATSVTAPTSAQIGSTDISPQYGITGTPVIDAANNVIYLVTLTAETVGTTTEYVQRLHAINLSNGQDAVTPYLIGATISGNTNDTNNTQIFVYGSGAGSITDPYYGTGNPVVQFDALIENQRAALSLRNGVVYVEWASHSDSGPYHGWLVGWNVSNLSTAGLQLAGVFNTSPNTIGDGIWQGGAPPAFDAAGNMYLEVGNGIGTHPNPVLNAAGFPANADYADAVLKLQTDPASSPQNQNANGWGIKVSDYFIPYNQVALDEADDDLGAGGPLLLPAADGVPGTPNLLLAAGKQGIIYVINTNDMGHWNASTDDVVSELGLYAGILNAPSYYNGDIYFVPGYGADADEMVVNQNGTLTITSSTVNNMGFLPGGPTVSSYGSTNGLVWVEDRGTNELHAFDAGSLATEIWNSDMKAGEVDAIGALNPFSVPTVANGEVLVGTTDALVAYGLEPPTNAAPLPPVLSSIPLSNTSIGLSWTDPTASPNTSTGYLIEESTDGVNFTQITSVAAGMTSYDVGGLTPQTQYYFRIRGFNIVGDSIYSNIVQAVTSGSSAAVDYVLGFDGETGLVLNGAAAIVGNSLELTNGSTDQAGSAFSYFPVPIGGFTTTFAFQLIGAIGDGFTFTIQGSGPTALGSYGSGLGYGGTYGAGPLIGQSVAIVFDLDNGGTVGNDATGLFTDGADATTNASTIDLLDMTSSGVNLRAGGTLDVTLSYAGTTLTETVTNPTNQDAFTTQYTVNIPALVGGQTAYVGFTGGTGGATATQNIQSWTFTPSSSTQAPLAPSALGAEPASATSITLAWTNNATNQTGYALDRATDPAFTQNLITLTLPANPTTYTDTATGLSPGGTYYYRLRATNANGSSANSNVATASIPVAPAKATNAQVTFVSTSAVDLSWTDNAGITASGITILRKAGDGSLVNYATLPAFDGTPPNIYTWTDTGVQPGTAYEYHIETFNVSGYNDFAGTNAETLTLPPSGFTAILNNGAVALSWTAPAGAVSYNIYRGTTSGGETLLTSGVTATTYTDSTVAPGTNCYYEVTAVNANATNVTPLESESAFSNEVSVGIPALGLLAYEGFSGAAGALEGEADGAGWNASAAAGAVGWNVQNANATVPGYQINAGGLTYPGLQTAGGSASGGSVWLTAGRRLDTTGVFSPYDVPGSSQIGAAGTTLWFSVLVNRQSPVGSGQTPTSVDFTNSASEWYDSPPEFGVGYYGALSDNAGSGYWSLDVAGNVLKSNVPIVVGQTALLVLKMNFGAASDSFSLYVNPTSLGAAAPAVTSASLTGGSLTFSSVVYNAGAVAQVSSIDELRLGLSFAAVTPTPVVAVPPLTLSDASGMFTGTPFTATTASIEGVTPNLFYYAGTSATGTPLSGAPLTVGTYTVLARFAGSSDYTTGTASTTFTISQAEPSIDLTSAIGTYNDGTYNGAAFTAIATVAGDSGVFAPSLENVAPTLSYYSGLSASGALLSGAPSTAGSYTVLASFAGSTDYTSASASVSFTIVRATPSVTVNDAGGPYDAAPFTATTASIEGVIPILTYYAGTSAHGTPLGGPPSTVGVYSVLASFVGSTDYIGGLASTTFTIGKATPILTVTDAGGVTNGAAFPANDTVAGVGSQSTPAKSLEGVTPSLAYYLGTSASGTPLGGAPTSAGTYTALASFAGSTDYVSVSASATFAISSTALSKPTLTVTDAGGTYNAAAFAASETVAGVGNQSTPGASLESVTPTLTYYSGTSTSGVALSGPPMSVGTYTVLASFAGSADYSSGTASTTFSISKAAASLSVSDSGGTYNGGGFAASETVAGVGSQSTPGASLESVTPTLTYYAGTSASGTPLGSAPTSVGTYAVLASFAGSADYASGTASTTFTISAAGAGLLAYEGFSGSAGALQGQSDGTGWNTSASAGTVGWYVQNQNNTVPGYQVNAASLAYTGLQTSAGSASGGSVWLTAGRRLDTSGAFAAYDVPGTSLIGAAGTTLWFSVLVDRQTAVGGGQSATSIDFTNSTVAWNDSGPLFSVGYYGSASDSGGSGYWSLNVGGTVLKSATPVTVNQTALLVLQMSFTGTGDSFRLYVNPSSLGGSAPAAASATLTGGTVEFNNLVYNAGNVAGVSSIDELRIGPTFAAVTPASGGSVGKTPPSLTLIDNSGTYTSTPFTATTASIEGVTPTLTYYSGTSVSGTALSGPPMSVGTYTVLASFAGSPDYSSGTASTTFSISKAAASLNVSDSGGTYNGGGFAASETVAGVGSQSTPGANLESVTPTLSYYSGTTASGTPLGSVPTSVGTYTVLASFAGSADYTSETASTTFTISAVGAGLLAYEGFSGSAGALNGEADGSGWNTSTAAGAVGWSVQNSSTAVPGYQVNAASLTYSGLQTSAGSASGGTAWLTAGRRLDTSGAFAAYDVPGSSQIGAAGTTLWFSVLADRQTAVGSGQSATSVDFTNSTVAWNDAAPQFGVGYYGSSSDSAGTGYWSLMVGGTVLKSTTPVVVNQTALLVLQMSFAAGGDSFSLYVNPTSLGGSAPAPASAELNGSGITFSNVVYNAGNTAQVSSIDELRFGQSFAAVTPVSSPAPQVEASDAATAAGAMPFHNPANPLDVLGTGGAIVPADALAVIDYLNTHPSGALPAVATAVTQYVDVLGSGSVVPLDALTIIDYLNTHVPIAGSTPVIAPAVTIAATAAGNDANGPIAVASVAIPSWNLPFGPSSATAVSPAVVASGQEGGWSDNGNFNDTAAAASASSSAPLAVVANSTTGAGSYCGEPPGRSADDEQASAVDSLLSDPSADWLEA